MNDQLQDRTILLIILATLLLIFLIIFSFNSKKIDQDKTIQWIDDSENTEFISPSQVK